jgi:hypothetical protein
MILYQRYGKTGNSFGVSDLMRLLFLEDDSAMYPPWNFGKHRAHAWVAPGHTRYLVYDYVISQQ